MYHCLPMLTAALRLCARVSCRRPWLVLGVGAAVAVLSIVYTTQRLQLNANLDDLIAPDRPFMEEYRHFLREFGDLEYIFVVLADAPHSTSPHPRNDRERSVDDPHPASPQGRERSRREAAVDYIGERLRSLDDEVVPAVFYAIEPDEQLRIATRAMSDAELRELADAAAAFGAFDAGAAAAVQHTADLLAQLMQSQDETEQSRLAAAAFTIMEAVTQDDLVPLLEREYLVSPSGKLHFIQVQPVRDFGTLAVIQEPLRQIRAVLAEARQEFPDVEIGLTGKPVLQADEMETSDRDMTRAFIFAIILVAILFMIVLGSIWHPLLAVVSLLFGIAWTFGFTTLFIGQLTLLSIVFTLVLVGVGIDFGVHIVSRYKEQRGRGAERNGGIEAAMTTTLITAGRGNVTGAVTSSMAFFMAMFTEFHGLRELGFIAGCGLLLCLLAMLLMLPSLIVVFDRHREQRGYQALVLPTRTALQRSAWNVLMARPGTWMLIMLGLTLLLSPFLRNLGFGKNLLELQAQGLESVKWERRILDDSGESFFGAVIVDTKEEALNVIARAAQQPAVARAGSVFDIVQPSTPQRDALRQRLHDAPIIESPQRTTLTEEDLSPVIERMSLIVTGAQMQDLPEAPYLASLLANVRALHAQLANAASAHAARVQVEQRLALAAERVNLMLEGDQLPLREALPHAVRNMYISKRGQLLVSLYPVENVWEFEPMERFVAAMREIDPDATGVPITQYESLIEMLRAFIIAASLAFIAVFILLWLDLRKLGDAVLATVPLLVGMLWLLQWMAIFNLEFNHANFFAVPILIGIGVDSGIHLMRRYREVHPESIKTGSHDAEDRSTFGSTRRAVFMTSMTSLIGFGCLAMASHRGLQSLGLVMAIGATTLMIASLFVLPALLAWLERRGERG